jgi:hypothetical protein
MFPRDFPPFFAREKERKSGLGSSGRRDVAVPSWLVLEYRDKAVINVDITGSVLGDAMDGTVFVLSRQLASAGSFTSGN